MRMRRRLALTCFFYVLCFSSVFPPRLRDCAEFYRAGFTSPGFYKADPSGARDPNTAVLIYCKDGWTRFLKRENNEAVYQKSSLYSAVTTVSYLNRKA